MAATVTWERVAHHSHLKVLPVVGAWAVVTGLLGVLGVHWVMSGFLPLAFALVVVGSAVLVGSVASYMCLPTRAIRVPEPSPNRSPSAGQAPPTTGSPTPRPRESPRDGAIPHSGIGRATLAHLTKVEDELWRRWDSPPAASLGSPVVGPVASTAYSPHKAGAFVPFPERDRDAIVLSSAPRSTLASNRPRRPRPEGRPTSSSGEIVIRRRASGSEGPGFARPEDPSGALLADEPGTFLSGRAGMLTLDLFDHPVDIASINPILPRLRPAASPTAERARRSPPMANGEPAVRRFCGECSRLLTDFRSWVECRFCRKPLCRQCLQASFEGEEVGACMQCRSERARSYRSTPAPSRWTARAARARSATAR